MKKLFLMLIMLLSAQSSFAKDRVYFALDKDLCFSCKGALFSNTIELLNSSGKYDVFMLVTNVSPKNVKYYKKEIDQIFNKKDILYDTLSLYKKKLKIKKNIEYFVTNENDVIIERFIDIDKLIDYAKENRASIQLIKKDSFNFDDSYNLVSTVNVFQNDALISYDRLQNKILFYNVATRIKSSFPIEQCLAFIQPRLPFRKVKENFGNTYKEINFISYVDGTGTKNKFLAKYVDTIVFTKYDILPIFKYVLFEFNNKGIIGSEDFILPERFVFHGSNELIWHKDKYYASIYDKRYHHTKHNEVKDTTSIFIGFNGKDERFSNMINYTLADSLSGNKYGLFFVSKYYLFDDKFYFINAENGIFASISNSGINNFIKPESKLQSIVDSHKNLNKDDFLNGRTYERNCKFALASFTKTSKYFCVLLIEYIDNIDSERENFIIQLYNLDGTFAKEHSIQVENNSSKIKMNTYKDQLQLIIYDDEKLEVYEAKGAGA